MSTGFHVFKNLHQGDELFILPNAWDVKSALLFQEMKFPAVATSSAALSASLGYEDGENMPFGEYLFIIKRMLSTLEIPLTVDMEMGYGRTQEEIAANILKLAELGVAGINIEDSIIRDAGRTLGEAVGFAKQLEYIRGKLESEKLSLFINIRCDTYLLDIKNKQEETARRLKLYESAGADGIFLPCISRESDIGAAAGSTTLPINVMCIPALPGFTALNQLGVKRVSMGPFLFNKVYQQAGKLTRQVLDNRNFHCLFDD